MEESQEILLSSLKNSGVSIPEDVSAIQDLTPETLVSICTQCLYLIDGTGFSANSLPDLMVDKFKICTDIALAVKRLGYTGDMNYYKLLYASEEDVYKLMRFWVERLSESSDKPTDVSAINAKRKMKEDDSANSVEDWMQKADDGRLGLSNLREKLKDLSVDEVPELFDSEAEDGRLSMPRELTFSADMPTFAVREDCSTGEGNSERSACGNEDAVADRDDIIVQNIASSADQSSKIGHEMGKVRYQEKLLKEELTAKTLELGHLEEEFKLLKAAEEMVFDEQHPLEFYVQELNDQADAKKCRIEDLKSEWNASRKLLEEKKRSLQNSVYEDVPGAQEKLQKLREIELEEQSIFSEICRREEEHSKLSADLEKQPKVPSRASYIERINEITKNSWKQDADMEKILKETRELQLESNSIQERLHRTYAVLDEMIFREAKKDPAGRQAYRLLTSLHEIFEQISEKILTTDRIQREAAEHEKKLAAIASKSLNINKVQADLDVILKENECLERHIQDS
ncbi:hypothetical protein K2173_010569 [Erythroxylum novogranatense]|uniref:Coiled-coil domain-containing protein 22 homolog n=1 Tax=Erythroxylum novogranatense TaxID=1862640 RepID=A0AAV8TE02_9ROSI|nr:hypothetical protein K2173_010569 [Erythroxylum novogranatense]